jgi:hypothetical protein
MFSADNGNITEKERKEKTSNIICFIYNNFLEIKFLPIFKKTLKNSALM